MSEVKRFEFGAKRAIKEQIAGSFEIWTDSFEVRILNDSNIAFLIAEVSSSNDPSKVITTILNFMERALTEESYPRFRELVLGNPGLKLEEVVEVFRHVLTIVAAGNPTGSSKGSSTRPRSTGARSTAAARS